MMKKLSMIAAAALLLAACSNDDEPKPVVERLATDYFPNTVNTTWDYESSFFDYTQTITNGAKTIGGKDYFEMKIEVDGFPSYKTYARKEGTAYYYREVYKNQYDNGEYIFLKDAATGTTWEEISYDDAGLETVEELEIVETGGTYVVGDNEFTDVIVVKVSSYTDGASEPYVIFNYYAKGVGLIKVEDTNDFVTAELLGYTIIPLE